MCSIIRKKLGNIFQHRDNPGFIHDWEQHVQDANLGKNHKLHALGQCAQEAEKIGSISSIGKILQAWFHPGFGATCPTC